ncbi:BCL2/adenovirus E1B 19 kDa protein-interacting protein 2-like isoform X3 [Rana temporaria]|uniref:BCL2/adenovirus E1B 19 kDa protein-interacting protein 2-like isoform X3 n=1 Tax=Rana temporaria TaxID=8407 RepID=UPI001AAD9319|nr:BCL2/adenovirus E1B 19 kDa protein-interacting protein 2-like isoform X3 [Rana temporaria]
MSAMEEAGLDGGEGRSPHQSSKDLGGQNTAPSRGGRQSIDDMELKEEWQDEEFPRPLPEETTPEEDLDANEEDLSAAPPSTLDLCGNRHVKRRLSAPDISFNLENSQDSATSSDIRDQTTDEDLDFDVDDLETPNSSEMLEFPSMSHEFEWDGYYGNSLNAIVVFATCYLPESSIPNYQYIMDNLFRYIIGTLDLLVADDYMLIYLSGCTSRSKIPPIGWLKRCYRATGRRLKKNLKSVLIVHPTWYVRALLAIIRPFISAKFIRKVAFVKNLTELSQLVSLDPLHIPDCIEQLDLELKR